MAEHPALRHDKRLNQLLDEAIELKNNEEYERAEQAFARIADEYPNCAPAHGMRGMILFSGLKRPEEAISSFRKATELSPKSELASLGLFHSLWATDQIDEALAEIRRYQTLTDWTCRDYLEIVEELAEKWVDPPQSKKKAKAKR